MNPNNPPAFPQPEPEDAANGWKIDYTFLHQVSRGLEGSDNAVSMEQVEAVLLTATKMLAERKKEKV